MSKVKQLFIIFPLCFILAGLAVLLFLLDPAFIPDLYRITSMVIVVLWAFFIIPSLLFDINMIIERSKNETFEQSFRSGVRVGVFFGFGGLIILSFIISPLTGTMWFVQTIKAATAIKKKKELSEKPTETPDIFDI